MASHAALLGGAPRPTGYNMLQEDIFPANPPADRLVNWGFLLAITVTTLLVLQVTEVVDLGSEVVGNRAIAVLVLHLLTLPAVAYDYFEGHGTKLGPASLTIGFGIAATLTQTTVAAAVNTPDNWGIPFAAVVAQAMANGLMLAFIVGDLRSEVGRKARRD